MKRVAIFVMLLIVLASISGCRRGLRCWGLRGDRCAPPYSPYPAYPQPPAYAPPAYAPPAYAVPCPQTDYCPPCPPMDPCATPGTGYSTIETQPMVPNTAPGSATGMSPDGVYIPGMYPEGNVMFSKPVQDRIIIPTDSLPQPKATYES